MPDKNHRLVEPIIRSRTSEEMSGGSAKARRWQKQASSLGRAFEVVALLVFGAGVVYITRVNYLVTFILLVGYLLFVAVRVLNRSSVYELTVDETGIIWGWAGRRTLTGHLGYSFLESIQFYKRANGAGAIEFKFENGRSAILPAEFTEQPGVSDEILSKVREFAPQVSISVL